MANSQLTYMNGYPDNIGRRFAFVCTGKGPSSYDSTAKDILTLPGFQHYIDNLQGYVKTVSGTYYLLISPSVAGRRATWKAVWYSVGGVTEVTNAVDLSAETFILEGLGGPS